MDWSDDMQDELSAALLERLRRDDELDRMLYAWGEWSTGGSEVRFFNLGYECALGKAIKAKNRQQSTVSDYRPPSEYPTDVYDRIDRVRDNLTNIERGAMDAKYKERLPDNWICTRLEINQDGLNYVLMEVRDRVDAGVNTASWGA